MTDSSSSIGDIERSSRRGAASLEMRQGGADDDDEEEEQVQNVPPLSSFLSTAKIGWKFAKWPCALLIVNGIFLTTLFKFDEGRFGYGYRHGSRSGDDDDKDDPYLRMFKINSAVVAVLLFLDTICFVKAAQFMEKDIAEFGRGSELGAEGNDARALNSHVHGQVSRKMDRLLSGGSARTLPRVSIFLALLYSLAVLSSTGSLASFGLRCYASTANAKKVCAQSYRAELARNKTKIEGLPDALREWAGRWERNDDRVSGTYIRMVDGTTYFAGRKDKGETNETPTDDDFFYYDPRMLINLVSTSPEGTLQVYPDVGNPRMFTSVKGENNLASTAFCCLYTNADVSRKRHAYPETTETRALCVSSSNSNNSFKNASLHSHKDSRSWYKSTESSNKFNGSLYYMSVWWRQGGIYLFDSDEGRHIMEIYKINPDTMELQSVANSTMSDNDRAIMESGSGACYMWSQTIVCAIAAAVTIPACFWLWKVKGTSAGAGPASMTCFYVLLLINKEFAYGIAFLAVAATTLSLLGSSPPPWMDREALVWIHYTILVFFVVYDLLEEDGTAMTVFAILSGIILSHPVLEIVGWIVGTGTVFVGFFYVCSVRDKEVMFEYLYMVPLMIIVGCGFVTAGRFLKKYRAFLRFHLRRLWRAMDSMSAQQRSSGGRDRAELTRGLLNDPRL